MEVALLLPYHQLVPDRRVSHFPHQVVCSPEPRKDLLERRPVLQYTASSVDVVEEGVGGAEAVPARRRCRDLCHCSLLRDLLVLHYSDEMEQYTRQHPSQVLRSGSWDVEDFLEAQKEDARIDIDFHRCSGLEPNRDTVGFAHTDTYPTADCCDHTCTANLRNTSLCAFRCSLARLSRLQMPIHQRYHSLACSSSHDPIHRHRPVEVGVVEVAGGGGGGGATAPPYFFGVLGSPPVDLWTNTMRGPGRSGDRAATFCFPDAAGLAPVPFETSFHPATGTATTRLKDFVFASA